MEPRFFLAPALVAAFFMAASISSDDLPVPTFPSNCEAKKEVPKDEAVETSHWVTVQGQVVRYIATAGQMIIKDDQECPKASIFYVAYTKKGVEDTKKRPITFCFNGGPGSCSVWLHLGAFGPRRILFTDDGFPQRPYQLTDNEFSLLDVTDLVFIDPVSTGYSRALPGQDPKQFYGVLEDVQAVGEFIRLYASRNSRWQSPLFLAGESYGTTRAAALASYLQDKVFMSVDGVILVSSVLDFQTINLTDSFSGNDLPYILQLPTFASTAWYYKKMPENTSLPEKLEEVEEFALNEYALALMQGDQLAPEKRKEVIQKLSAYSGLSTDYLEKANMRVDVPAYEKELLSKEGRVIGRFDTRYEGIEEDPTEKNAQYDPSMDGIAGGFTATFNDYIRTELNWKRDEEYRILANVFPWRFGNNDTQTLNVALNLRDVMIKNTALRIFVASGLYDLATPYFAMEYTFSHLYLDSSIKKNVIKKFYDGGHMMYLRTPVLKKLKEDLADYIKVSLNEPAAPPPQKAK